jgi:carboxylate-amine ligase
VTVRSVGVEEELLLVDPGTLRLKAVSDRVVGRGDDELEQELFLTQVEIASDPSADLDDVVTDLRGRRRRAAEAASEAGATIMAAPTPVLPDPDSEVTPKARYQRMMGRFGELGRQAVACGMHVHVDVDGPDEAVGVVDRLRPWLPVIQAVSTNSPYNEGVDTGYASWRAQVWDAWPSAGPTEPFGDAEHYRAAVKRLVASGAAIDEAMIYLDARLARAYPTVEVRVADVCTDLGTTALVAALIRATVTTVAQEHAEGRPLAPWRVDLLRGARWRASRHGLADRLVHPVTAELVPAYEAVEALVAHTLPALEQAGDAERVAHRLKHLQEHGSGAQRQCRVAGDEVDLEAVVRDLLERTRASYDD